MTTIADRLANESEENCSIITVAREGNLFAVLNTFNNFYATTHRPVALYIPYMCLKVDSFWRLTPSTTERVYAVLYENHVTWTDLKQIVEFEKACELDLKINMSRKN